MLAPTSKQIVGGPAKLREASTKQAQVALQLLRDFFGRRKVSSLLTLFQDYDIDNSGRLEMPRASLARRVASTPVFGASSAGRNSSPGRAGEVCRRPRPRR